MLQSRSQGASQAAGAAPKHDSGKLLEKSVADALAKATPEQKKAAAEHDKRTKEFFASEPARKSVAKAVGDFAKKHAAAMANYHLTDAILLPGVHHVVEQAVSAIGFGSVPGLTLGATAVAAYAASQLIERYHLNLTGAKELLAPVVRGMIDVLGNVKETSARIADLEKRGLIGAEDAARDPSVLDSLILLLMEVEKLGEEEQAQDEAPFEESKHPRDAHGEFTSKGNEGAGGESGEEEKNPDGKKVSTNDIVKKANANAEAAGQGGLDDVDPLTSAKRKYKAAMQLGSNYASATWATTTDEDNALKQVYGSTEDAWKALSEAANNPAGSLAKAEAAATAEVSSHQHAQFKAEVAKIDNAEGAYANTDTNLKSAEAKIKAAIAFGEAPDDVIDVLSAAEDVAVTDKYGSVSAAYADMGVSGEIEKEIGGTPFPFDFNDAIEKIDDQAGKEDWSSEKTAEAYIDIGYKNGMAFSDVYGKLSNSQINALTEKYGSPEAAWESIQKATLEAARRPPRRPTRRPSSAACGRYRPAARPTTRTATSSSTPATTLRSLPTPGRATARCWPT